MRKIILTACCFSSILYCEAQKAEIHATLYSGIAKFKGEAAVANSAMIRYGSSATGFTNNPYGTKSGFSAGGEIHLTLPTKFGMLFNLGAGFEQLAPAVGINFMTPESPVSSLGMEPATGKTKLKIQFITVGYRIKAAKLRVDVNAGILVTPCLTVQEKGKATSVRNSNYQLTSDRKMDEHPKNDLRPALQAMVHYKKWGFVAGYQFGIRNFSPLLVGSNSQLESQLRFLKLGLAYQLK